MAATNNVEAWLAKRDEIRAWIAADEQRPIVVRLADGSGLVEIRHDVPRTRAECPEQRPCGHVRCKFHLWREDDREGRPRRDGRRPAPVLAPAWLLSPTPDSCTLDVAERVAEGKDRARLEDIAQDLRLGQTRFYLITVKAKKALESGLAKLRGEED